MKNQKKRKLDNILFQNLDSISYNKTTNKKNIKKQSETKRKKIAIKIENKKDERREEKL